MVPHSLTSCPHSNYRDSLGHQCQPRCTNSGGTPSRWKRSRIAANNSRSTATSYIQWMTYREWVTIFAPVLIIFFGGVVIDQRFTDH